MTKPMIVLEGVARRYGSGEAVVEALRPLSLSITAGEFVAVVGPSGSGKSTLLGLLSGIDRPSTGSVWVAGQQLDGLSENGLARWRRDALGIVFQFFQLLPTLSALENVLLPMELKSVPRAVRLQRARALLERVGLAERADHLPSQLSGGEQQRIAIARALANDPPLILADEPTGNLDERIGGEIMDLLVSLHDEGKTLVLVTHDRQLARRAQRVIEMHNGQIVSGAQADHRPAERSQ